MIKVVTRVLRLLLMLLLSTAIRNVALKASRMSESVLESQDKVMKRRQRMMTMSRLQMI